MMQSLFSAKMGVIAQQARTDVIANNIANINTHGFRSSSVSFKDALYSTMKRPQGMEQEKYNLQQGNGVVVSSIARSFTPGAPYDTGLPLDMRIDGDAFFTVAGSDNIPNYTRNGCFAVSNEKGVNYLVNTQGKYVLDENGNKIKLPSDMKDITVNNGGEISANGVYIATLGLASFPNNNGLEATQGTCFKATDASGAPVKATGVSIYQGQLEGSNVDFGLEMTKLIRAQRALSLASSAIKTADEMTAVANNMRT
jgi:flagellar basal-body rod protein FlgG